MSLRWKLFTSHFLAIAVALGALYLFVHGLIERGFLAVSEAALIDEARGIVFLCERALDRPGAGLAEAAGAIRSALDVLRADQRLKSQRLGFTEREVALRVRLVDAHGRVVFDSGNDADRGKDFSRWRDVAAALAGSYGARTTLDPDEDRVYLYSTLPVVRAGQVAGAVSLARPTNQVVNLIWKARRNLLLLLGASTLLALVAAWAITHVVTRPILDLTAVARRIAAGERTAPLPVDQAGEVGQLARAFRDMTCELEGKNYIQAFVTDLSHELKAPLSGIQGAAELLAEGATDDPAARATFLRRIQNETRRLARLVRDLLEICRLDAGPGDLDLGRFEIGRLVEEIRERHEARARDYGITFGVDLPAHTAFVRADRKRIEQVLDNLVENAFDFTAAGGRVLLQVGVDDGAVEIAVCDSGAGVQPTDLPRLGTRFFTTIHPRTGEKGTGLGLAIVLKILVAHGTTLDVHSTPGQGTSFAFLLRHEG